MGDYHRMKYFEGRVRRSTYCIVMIGIVASAIAIAFLGEAGLPDMVLSVLLVTFIVGGNVLIISFSIRRLHDMDKSGWWILLFLVPLANLILGIILLVRSGTNGHNRFGPEPV